MAGNRARMIGVCFAAASCAALMLAQSALAQGLQKAPAGVPLQRNLPPVLMGPRQPPAPTLALASSISWSLTSRTTPLHRSRARRALGKFTG